MLKWVSRQKLDEASMTRRLFASRCAAAFSMDTNRYTFATESEKNMKDWLFAAEDYVCSLRTAGVLVRNGKILVQRERDGQEYALPGGHVAVGESTEDALRREFFEETGAQVCCRRLLWTEECVFTLNGKKRHSITFYYLIALCEGNDIADNEAWIAHKDNEKVLVGWLPVDRLDDVVIYPAFIRQEIGRLNGEIRHFTDCQ